MTLHNVKVLLPGLMVVGVIALAAQFISEHYGAPAMLMALLFGIALHFVSEEERPKAGINFAAKTILRLGVALLGLRISTHMMVSLGWEILVMLVMAVGSTILFGLLCARFFGFRQKFAFLSAGSVAICGASAAMAISAVLSKDERTEERLVFTVVGVTILSTVAMILYPVLGAQLGLSDFALGVFLGATIHDVAQVVGAGFSVSQETGEIATIVKLVRVAMLAPVIILATFILRVGNEPSQDPGTRAPLVPLFVIGFFGFVTINSLGLVPSSISDFSGQLSRWALLAAIAAVGVKTSLKDMFNVGSAAIGLLLAETVFIALFVLGYLFFI